MRRSRRPHTTKPDPGASRPTSPSTPFDPVARAVANIMADRQHELIDAVVAAAALVARADGEIERIERCQLLSFVNRQGLLATTTRAEILDAFEHRINQLQGRGRAGMRDALESVSRLAGRSLARLALGVGESVAIADGNLHASERQVLAVIGTLLHRSVEPRTL